MTESGNTNGETFTTVLSDSTGGISADGVGVTGSGTPFLTLSGSLSQVQDDLASVAVTKNGPIGTETGADTIEFSASDSLGGSSGPVATVLTINPQVTPVINAPVEATLSIGLATPITGVSLSEAGALHDETFQVSLNVSSGVLSATGVGVKQLAPASIVVSGSFATVNDDLATLTGRDTEYNSTYLSIGAVDSLGNDASPLSIPVSVAADPLIATTTQSLLLGVDQPNIIGGLTLTENGASSVETFAVVLSDSTGLLSAPGIGGSGVGTTSLKITGSLASVNATLANLTDLFTAPGSDILNVEASDSLGGQSAGTTSLAIASELPSFSAPEQIIVVQGSPTSITVDISDPGNVSGKFITYS